MGASRAGDAVAGTARSRLPDHTGKRGMNTFSPQYETTG